ncbi:MAG: hypothetical protein RJA61_216, partial [Candidatus Parcubacteria bacterium]
MFGGDVPILRGGSMSKRVSWPRVVLGVTKLVTGSRTDMQRFVERLLKSNRSNATNIMIYYHVWMYTAFCAIKKESDQTRALRVFSPSIRKKLVAIDKKVS